MASLISSTSDAPVESRIGSFFLAIYLIKGICVISPEAIFIKGGLKSLIISADHWSKTVEKIGLIGKEKAIACEAIASLTKHD